MAVQRYSTDGFCDSECLKRYDGAWQNIATAKRFDGNEWIDLLGRPENTVVTYEMTDGETYWNNGSRDSQSVNADSLIQGTWNGSVSSARRSLMWFDDQMYSDASRREIANVEIFIKRENSTHGNAGKANLHLKMHNYTAKPSTWTGQDLGGAASVIKLSRGESGWFSLNEDFIEAVNSGSRYSIALDADRSESMSDYCRIVRTGADKPKIRITYEG